MELPIPVYARSRIDTIYDFDDLVTAPLHGFRSAEDYYQRSSSRQFIPGIRIPTLLIHAEDDPLMTPDVIPTSNELPPCVQFDLCTHGGHVGFIQGQLPLHADYWLDQRVESWLQGY